MKHTFLQLVFSLSLLAWTAVASPVINEVLFDPSDASEADGEWIELYNDSGAGIDMEGYVLTDQDGTFNYTFPAGFTLAADGYVRIHVGSGTDDGANVYAGLATAQLDNSGDDLLLQDDLGNDLDYIAYGSGGEIDAVPAGLSWTSDIDISGASEDDTLALYPNGVDQDDGNTWFVFSGADRTPGADNGEQSEPSVSFDAITPDATSTCTDIQVDLSVENTDTIAAIADVELVVTVPADYYYISSTPAGVYDAGAHTITWDLAEIAAGATESVELHVQGSCAAASGSTLDADVTWRRYDGGPEQTVATETSGAITLQQPSLSVDMGEFNTGATTVWRETGETVEYKVTVDNAGPGDNGGVAVDFTLGMGLSLVAIKHDSATGTSVSYTSSGNVHSWTTDPLPSGGSEVYYLRADKTACSNLDSSVQITSGCADFGGSPSCEKTDSATTLVRCPLTYTITNTLPEDGGTYVNSCQEMTTEVEIANPGESIVNDAQLVLTIPDDFFFASATDNGTYDAATHTITWDATDLGEIAAGGTKTVQATVKPACQATPQQRIEPELTFGGTESVTIPRSAPIPVRIPNLATYMEDDENLGSTTILAGRGDIIRFRLTVDNSGSGDLVNGTDISLVLGQALPLTTTGTTSGIRDSSGNPLTYAGTGTVADPFTWDTGRIDHDSEAYYTIEVKVDGCENLINEANYSWGCSDVGGTNPCMQTSETSSSVKILLKTPLLTITPPDANVDWCGGGSVSFPVENIGSGPARNTQIDITGWNLDQVDITTTGDFSFTRNGAVAEFRLTAGTDTDNDGTTDDLAAGSTATLSYDVAVKGDGTACAASGNGGILLHELLYLDDCDVEYNAGTETSSFSIGNRPSVSISKSANTGDVNVGENNAIEWTITVANNSTQDITGATITDDYPDTGEVGNDYGDFTITDADGGDTTTTPGTVIWSGQTIPAGGSWSKTITADAPNNTCAGGNVYQNTASVTFAEATGCNGCPIPGDGGSAGHSVTVNNNDEGDIVDATSRSVTYENINSNGNSPPGAATSGEVCAVTGDPATINGGVHLSATIQFGSAAPDTWDDTDGNGNHITFTDELNNNLEIPASTGAQTDKERIDLYVTYAGNDITDDVLVSFGTELVLSFENVDEAVDGKPSDQGTLEISYILYAPEAAAGGFNSWQVLTIPNNIEGECNNAAPETFSRAVGLNISNSGANISVSKLDAPTDKVDICETATYRFNVSRSSPFTMYDTKVEIDLNGSYEFVDGSTVFSGFTDEDDAAVSTFAPTEAGTTLSWSFGDLRTGGTIEVDLIKRCDDPVTTLQGTVYTHSNCANVPDGTGDGDNARSGQWNAAILRRGELEVTLAPETYFAKTGYPEMRFYITNSGNGRMYNIEVPLVFDNDLEYYDQTASLPAGTGMTISQTDSRHVTFEFDVLGPGEQLYVDFTAKMLGCSELDVDIIDTVWGCNGQTTECDNQIPQSANSVVEMTASEILVSEHIAEPQFIDYCGSTSTFTISVVNSGITEVYETIVEENLAEGLSFFSSFTPEYRIDLDGNGWDAGWTDFPNGGYTTNTGTPATGKTLTWNFMDPNGDGDENDSLVTTTDGREGDADGLRHFVLQPDARLQVRLRTRIADCTDAQTYHYGDRKSQARILFDSACNHINTGAPTSATVLNVETSPPADANVDVLVEGKNDTGAPWSTNYTNAVTNAEQGQNVKWRFTLTSNGEGAAQVVTLDNVFPDNVSYANSYTVTDSSGGISVQPPTGTGTAGDPLTFVIDNGTDDPDTTDVDESTYLEDGEYIVLVVDSTVDSCAPVSTDMATVTWGCCQATGIDESSGENVAAADLQTIPDQAPNISITEKTGSEFTGCSGAYTIEIQNNHDDFTLYDFQIELDELDDFGLDTSTDAAVEFAYTGAAAQRTGNELTETEEIPDTGVGVFSWAGASDGGSIPDAKAALFGGETITIDVQFFTDGAVCDSGSANDATDPDVGAWLDDFTTAVNATFDDSCGTQQFAESDTVTVNPEQSDVDIAALTPDQALVQPGDTVQWTFTLENEGDLDTSNLEVEFTLGDGYVGATLTRVSGSPTEDGLNTTTNTVTWNRGTVSLDASGGTNASRTWVYQAEVAENGGDLSATVDVDGFCIRLDGDDSCQYTDDQTVAYVAGGELRKTIKEVHDPAVITDPGVDTTANATIGNVITYSIEAEFSDAATYTNVTITDELPAGMELVSSSYTTGQGSTPTPDGTSGGTYTWQPRNGTNPDGTVDGPATFAIDVLVRVVDEAGNTPGTPLANTAQLTFDVHGQTFDAATYPADLQKQNTATVILADIQDDADYAKTAVPVGPSAPGGAVLAGDTIDYTFTAKNAGDAPAYDILVDDTLPVGLRASDPSGTVVVGVDTTGDTTIERTLTATTDYTVGYTVATGALTIQLLNTGEAHLHPGETLIVTYTATVDSDVAPGLQMNNAAQITSYTTLPDTGDAADSEVDKDLGSPGTKNTYHYTPAPPTVEKTQATSFSPDDTQATIGELVTYTLTLSVPEDTTAHDLELQDTIPDGLTVQDATYSYENPAGGADITGPITFTEQGDGTWQVTSGSIGDVQANANTGDNLVTITIEATIDDTYNDGTTQVLRTETFDNTGTFVWNYVNDDPTTSTNTATNTVTLTVIEPNLTNLVKDMTSDPGRGTGTYYHYSAGGTQNEETDIFTVLPDDTLDFEVTFENTGDAVAHDIVLNDAIPDGQTYVATTIAAAASDADDLTVTVNTTDPLNVTFSQLNPGATLTVTYQTTVDQNIGAGYFMQNSAEITDYSSLPAENSRNDIDRDTSSTPAYAPLGPVADEGVGVQNPTLIKRVYRLIGDAGGAAIEEELADGADVRLGEVLRYELEVTLPKYTTLYEGNDEGHVLFRDTLPGGFARIAANDVFDRGDITLVEHASPTNSGTAEDEIWTWSFNDVVNNTNGPQTATLAFEVKVTNTHGDYPDNQLEYTVTNAARVTWDTDPDAPEPGDSSDTDDPLLDDNLDNTVTQPAFEEDADYAKTVTNGPACGADAVGTDVISYRFTAKNTGNNRAYDLVFEDTLPLGMRGAQPANIAVQVGTDTLVLNTDYTVAWDGGTGLFTITLLETDIAQPEPGELLQIDYDVTVENSVGVDAINTNAARIQSYSSFPGTPAGDEGPERTYGHTVGDGNESYVGDATCQHATPEPTVTKTVETAQSLPAGERDANDGSSRATFGEQITFRLNYDIPENTTVYDLTFTDTLPDGLTVQQVNFIYNDGNTTETNADALTIPAQVNGETVFTDVPVEVPADTSDFSFGAGVNPEITVEIFCTVDLKYSDGTDVAEGDVLANTGGFEWNYENDAPATARGPVSDSENFTIIEPSLANLAKTVDSISTDRGTDTFYYYTAANGTTPQTAADIDVVLPGDEITYQITVENTDAEATAHDIVLRDTYPADLSYVAVDSVVASVEGAIGYTVVNTDPLDITVDHLKAGETLTITYRLSVDTGVAVGRVLRNSAEVIDYSSIDDDNGPYFGAEEKTSDSDPAFADLGPEIASVGVKNTTIATDVYRLYDDVGDDAGALTDSVDAGEVRLGEIVQYEITLDLWDNTSFLEGGAQEHFIVQIDLPEGVQRIDTQDEFDLGTLSNALVLSASGVINVDTNDNETWRWHFDDITNSDGADKAVKLVFKAVVTNDFNDYDDNTVSHALPTDVRVVWDTTDSGERGDVSDDDRPRLDDSLSSTLTQPDINNDHSLTATPACGNTVTGGDQIDFTFTATNTGSAGTKATAYDLVFVADIPLELRDATGPVLQTLFVNGTDIAGGGHYTEGWDQGTGVYTITLNRFADAQLLKGEDIAVTFRVNVIGTVGTDTFWQTDARIDSYTSFPADADTLSGSTYPDKEREYGQAAGETDPTTLSCNHNTATPSPDKSVTMRQTLPAVDPTEVSDDSARATIGERVTYYARLTVPENTTVYDLEFDDTVPDGLTVHSAEYIYTDPATGNLITPAVLTIDAEVDGSTRVHGSIGDIEANTTTGDNEIEITLVTTVDQTYNDGTNIEDTDTFANSATLSWNRQDGGTHPDDPISKVTDSTPQFMILEPTLASLNKSFDPGDDDLRDSNGTTVVNRGTDTFYYYDGPNAPNQDSNTTDVVLPDDYLRFTVQVENTGTTTAYDIRLLDTLPVELLYNTDIDAITATASDAATPDITDNTAANTEDVDFTFSHLNAGETLTITYWTRVEQYPGAGRHLENSAEITDYDSLDSRLGEEAGVPNMADRERDTASTPAYNPLGPVTETAGIQWPTFDKTAYRILDVDGDTQAAAQIAAGDEVRVGERVRYRLTVTMPRRTTLFDGNDADEHVIFFDTLAPGFERVAANDDFTQGDIDVSGEFDTVTSGSSANRETNLWRFSDVQNTADAEQTLVVQYDVEVTNENTGGTEIYTDNTVEVTAQNNAEFYWDTEEASGNEPGGHNAADEPHLADSESVDVVQPDLSITKASDDGDGVVNANQFVTYTLEISNNTPASDQGAAYDVTVEDTLPIGMRQTLPTIVGVEIQDIATSTTQRALTTDDYDDDLTSYSPADGELTITTQYNSTDADYAARIGPGEKLVVEYEVTVDADIGAGSLINEAILSSYYSLGSGVNDADRKVYPALDPVYVVLETEGVSITKTSSPVSGSDVEEAETITYTLVVPGTVIDATMYDIEIIDEIPDGLEVVDPQAGDLSAGDIQVTGGVNVAIAVSGPTNRQITVTADKISDDDGDGNDEPINPGGDADADQIIVTIVATVNSSYDDGRAIRFFHEFENTADFYWYDRAAAPRNRYSVHSGKVAHRYKPSGILFEPNHTETAQPGTVKVYRHLIRNFEDAGVAGNEDITITYPASSQGWQWLLYPGDGDGNIDGTLIESGDTITVPGDGGQLEIIARAFVPADTPPFTTDVFEITATGPSNAITVINITTVQNGRMTIRKDISHDNVTYETTLDDVQSGDQVYQRLTFYVNGDEAVKNVTVYDAVPENTQYLRDSYTAFADADLDFYYSTDGGVTWTAGEPATDAVAAQVTNLKWEYIANGNMLLPGIEKEIVFQFEIE